MEITGLILYMLAAFSVVASMWALKNAWNSTKEIKQLSVIARSMPEYRWLITMGMREQAKNFNAFGLRTKNHMKSI